MSRLTASLMLNVFDGARQPLSRSLRVLVRLYDGAGRAVSAGYHRGPSVYFTRVPCYNDPRDNYRVVISAPGCYTTGFQPVRLKPGVLTNLDMMLLPRQGSFNFRAAVWPVLSQNRPLWARLLRRELYEQLIEERPRACAGLLNLLAALEQTPLQEGSCLDYLMELIWDPAPAPDRFFAWARVELLDRVEKAAHAGLFKAERLPGVFHPGATSSFKQTRFPFANLQITFHGQQRTLGDGIQCVKIEPDMDYYPDLLSHTLLEVLPNHLLSRTTDPAIIYMLRWTASRWAGAEEFDPPYTIV